MLPHGDGSLLLRTLGVIGLLERVGELVLAPLLEELGTSLRLAVNDHHDDGSDSYGLEHGG